MGSEKLKNSEENGNKPSILDCKSWVCSLMLRKYSGIQAKGFFSLGP